MKFYNDSTILGFLSMSIAVASALQSNAPENPQSLTSTICDSRSDGRSFCDVELDVPASCVDNLGESSCPIVFFFHGSGGNNAGFKRQSGVHDEGFIGVYPQGEKGWNTGPKNSNNCHWTDFECTTDPDEGDYIASIISEIKSQGGTGNVYAIGNSNGAALAHRLAANAGTDLPIKGIVAKVTQLLASPERSGPGVLNYNQPSTGPKVSILSVMGTADGLIPYEGGSSGVFGGDDSFQLMSALESMNVWATHNGCSGANNPTSTTHSTDMGTGVATKYDYRGCVEGTIVEHFEITGGEHNAGSVTVDSEKVDYVIAFDFIRRVENVIPSAPTAQTSPVAAPVVSPTSIFCTNDPNWAGKMNAAHTCDFVADNPHNRCSFENAEGIKAEVACREVCNPECTAAPVASPIAAPVAAPVISPVVAPTSTSCTDDPNWSGKMNTAHTCDFVAENPNNRCFFENSEGVKAEDACPEACNIECTIAPMGVSPVAAPVISPVASLNSVSCTNDATWAGKFNVAHTCDYIGENPQNRCFFEDSDGVKAEEACPEACNPECTTSSGGIGVRHLRRRRRN